MRRRADQQSGCRVAFWSNTLWLTEPGRKPVGYRIETAKERGAVRQVTKLFGKSVPGLAGYLRSAVRRAAEDSRAKGRRLVLA